MNEYDEFRRKAPRMEPSKLIIMVALRADAGGLEYEQISATICALRDVCYKLF